MPEEPRSRWLHEGGTDAQSYDDRWAQMAARGEHVHGEADLVESLGPRSVLDAGCGTGRVAVELARRGLQVTGVDLDPTMLDAARNKSADVEWVHGDLVDVDLGRRFDAIVLAGNVMIFVAQGTEEAVVANMARHLEDGGALVAGFQLKAGRLTLEDYDASARTAGLVLEERWATWGRDPFAGGNYAVSVHRRR